MPRRRKPLLATLLLMGEGAHEKAFLSHLKSLYDGRQSGQTVKVDAASGGSPIEIVDETIRRYHHARFDRKVVLLDSDVVIIQQVRDKARRNGIELIVSTPVCLEGMILELMGERVSETARSEDRKRQLAAIVAGDRTDPTFYAFLSKTLLDSTDKEQVRRLIQLISNS